nr:hypothetical protein CFP56_23363 [Quercus suber]
MASMQCYKPSNECSQPKSKDNSLVHKAAEMASCALKGNQQGHCATPAHGHGQHKDKGHHASNGMACHGKRAAMTVTAAAAAEATATEHDCLKPRSTYLRSYQMKVPSGLNNR